MTFWKKHGGCKAEEMSLTDMHTIIDALEFHREACHEKAVTFMMAGVPGSWEARQEVQDINRVLQAINDSGIPELVGRVPVDIGEPAETEDNGNI